MQLLLCLNQRSSEVVNVLIQVKHHTEAGGEQEEGRVRAERKRVRVLSLCVRRVSGREGGARAAHDERGRPDERGGAGEGRGCGGEGIGARGSSILLVPGQDRFQNLTLSPLSP